MSRLLVALLVLSVAATGFVLGRSLPVDPAPAGAAPGGPMASVDWSAAPLTELAVASVFVVARDRGARAAMDSLEVIAARDTLIDRRGHQIAHSLGRFVSRLGGNDPALLADCRPLYMAGCYHGVIESYMASLPQVDPARAAALCTDLEAPARPYIEVRECAHGLGHGLLTRLGYSLDAALGTCDALPTAVLREECWDGVFMQSLVRGEGLPGGGDAGGHHHAAAEAVGSDHEAMGQGGDDHAAMGHVSAAPSVGTDAEARFDPEDPAYPCNRVPETYQGACWAYQTPAIASLIQDGGEAALRACDTAPAPARARCYAGYGKQSMGWLGRDASTLIRACGAAADAYVDACLEGVVEGLVDAEWGGDAALAFCGAVVAGGRDGTHCFEVLGARVSLLHVDAGPLETVCVRAPDTGLTDACRRGAGLPGAGG